MQEFFSQALVLAKEDVGEYDSKIIFFTREYGKVIARATGIRKTTSKFAGHLQPLSFVLVRLVRTKGPKEGFIVADAMLDESFSKHKTRQRFDLLPIIEILHLLVLEHQYDMKLWYFLEELFTKRFNPVQSRKALLKCLGFEAQGATCPLCLGSANKQFLYRCETIVCDACASKLSHDEMVYIG